MAFALAVENKPLTLNLQAENKGGLLSGGELTVLLDGPSSEAGSLPNGPVVAEGERAGRWPALCRGWGWGWSQVLPAVALPVLESAAAAAAADVSCGAVAWRKTLCP